MNVLISVERALLANVARTYQEFKSIDDKTMKGDFFKFDRNLTSKTSNIVRRSSFEFTHDNHHLNSANQSQMLKDLTNKCMPFILSCQTLPIKNPNICSFRY